MSDQYHPYQCWNIYCSRKHIGRKSHLYPPITIPCNFDNVERCQIFIQCLLKLNNTNHFELDIYERQEFMIGLKHWIYLNLCRWTVSDIFLFLDSSVSLWPHFENKDSSDMLIFGISNLVYKFNQFDISRLRFYMDIL